MKFTSVLVLVALLGNASSVQLRSGATGKARQITMAECEAAQKSSGQVLAGCENFVQLKAKVDPMAPQQNMAQNKQAPAAPAKAPATTAAQAPAAPAKAPAAGQALAATKQAPVVTSIPDAASAAVAAKDATDAADKAKAAADAAGEALEDDGTAECSDDFAATLVAIIDAIEDTATQEKVFEIIEKKNPCGVDVTTVIGKFPEEDTPLPEDPTPFIPFVDAEELPSDEPELEVIIDLAEEEEPCVCEISEADIEKAEDLITDSFTEPVVVETDPDTGVVTVTDEATDEVVDKFPVDVLTDVITVVDNKEEAESDGEEVEPVVIIDNVQEILEEATVEKEEQGIPPNELAEDDDNCCGCCCGCDGDHDHK